MSKSWGVCTLNNWTEEELESMKNWDVTYMIIGKEVGAEGTPHLQFAVRFRKTYRLSGVKKLLERAHWETPENWPAAVNYCKKERDYDEFGDKSQGKRHDLSGVYECARSGMKFSDFLLEHEPNLQHMQIFRTAKLALMPDRPVCPGMEVIWLYEEPGCGKSREAYESGAFRVPSFKWWDGYDGEKAVWFDEVRGDFCKYHEWLKLLDIYPFQVEVKGGWVKVQFTKVYITSDRSPQEMWASFTEENMGQLLRRITTVKKFIKSPLGVVTVTEVGKRNTSNVSLPSPPVWSQSDLDML